MGKRSVPFQIKISHQFDNWFEMTGQNTPLSSRISPQTGDAPHPVAGYAAKTFLSFAAGILSPPSLRASAHIGAAIRSLWQRQSPTRRAGSVRRDTSLANATRGMRATRHLACQRDAREAWPDIFSSGLPVECSLLNRRDAIPRLSRTFRRRRHARKAKRYLIRVFFLLPFFLLQKKKEWEKDPFLFK